MKKCLATAYAFKDNLFDINLLYSLVVIGIIGVSTDCYSKTEKHFITLAQINHLEKSLSAFEEDIGRYPSSEEGLSILINRPTNSIKWNGPYYNKPIVMKDSWGSTFIYIFPSKYGSKPYDLYSIGKNGVDDNGKKDDISNWNLINTGFYN